VKELRSIGIPAGTSCCAAPIAKFQRKSGAKLGLFCKRCAKAAVIEARDVRQHLRGARGPITPPGLDDEVLAAFGNHAKKFHRRWQSWNVINERVAQP